MSGHRREKVDSGAIDFAVTVFSVAQFISIRIQALADTNVALVGTQLHVIQSMAQVPRNALAFASYFKQSALQQAVVLGVKLVVVCEVDWGQFRKRTNLYE